MGAGDVNNNSPVGSRSRPEPPLSGERPDTSPEELRARDLREELSYHEHRYHVLEYPLVSSRRYSEMCTELAELERGLQMGTPLDSNTLRRGSPARSHFELVRHLGPWIEPPAVRSQSELRRYFEALIAEDPDANVSIGSAWLAGLQVLLTYERGLLVRAALRGNGVEGEDVTDNVRTMGNVPLRLRPAGSITESRVTRISHRAISPSTTTPVPPAPDNLVVQGSITMRRVVLHALDRRRIDAGEPPYLKPKAAILSSVRRLDPKVTASRELKLFADAMQDPPSSMESHWQVLGALKSWGFSTTSLTWRCVGFEELLDFVAALQSERANFDYPLEGGLLTVNRLFPSAATKPADTPVARRVRLSFVTVAPKAKVQSVYRAVGRGGSVFPVATILRVKNDESLPESVPIPAASGTEMLEVSAGATVRALPGAIAPLVEVEDSGTEKGPSPEAQRVCPACGQDLRHPIDEPFWYCDNLGCRGRARARLLHLVGPRGLALKSVNAKLADRLVPLEVSDIGDLCRIDPGVVDRLSPGMGETFKKEIAQVRRLPLWRLLYLSSIPQLGERSARLVASALGNVENLMRLHLEAARGIRGLPPECLEGLMRWIRKELPPILKKLKDSGMVILDETESFAAPFASRHLALAGKFQTLSADRIIDELERRGGTIDARVSRRTDLLVTGKDADTEVASAAAYGVPSVDEAALIGLLRMTHLV